MGEGWKKSRGKGYPFPSLSSRVYIKPVHRLNSIKKGKSLDFEAEPRRTNICWVTFPLPLERQTTPDNKGGRKPGFPVLQGVKCGLKKETWHEEIRMRRGLTVLTMTSRLLNVQWIDLASKVNFCFPSMYWLNQDLFYEGAPIQSIPLKTLTCIRSKS